MNHSNSLQRRAALLAAALLLTLGLCSKTSLAQTPVADGSTVAFSKAAPGITEQSTSNPRDPTFILRSAKNIYVKSYSILVGEAVIESKLRKRSEFQRLGLIITRDPDEADLVLEVRHDRLTKYVFSAVDPSTSIVVASGKLSSLGGTVAGKVAKRFLKQILRARSQTGT